MPKQQIVFRNFCFFAAVVLGTVVAVYRTNVGGILCGTLCGILCGILCGTLLGQTNPLQPAWTEYFETDVPSWRILHSEKRGITVNQQRSQLQSLQGKKSEMFQFSLPPDSCVLLGHSIGFPLIIEDLQPTLCVQSNQPGIAIGAQIVLPNTTHPETGKPITYLVAGTKYTGSGHWEKLGFWDKNGNPILLQQAERLGKLLRAELKMNLDLRDKYIRQIVLFAEPETISPPTSPTSPSSPPPKILWIDSLEAVGHVAASDTILNRSEFEKQTFCFDPVNFDGFKIEAGLKSVYVQTIRSRNPVGDTEWVSPLANRTSSPLKATPVSGNIPFNIPFNPASQNTENNPITPHLPEKNSERSVFSEQNEIRFSLTNQQTQTVSPASLMPIRLSDQVLSVDDIPIGVRAIEYNGEPLAFLRQLEFNAAWIKERPTAALLQEAKTAGIWLICSPPGPSELSAASKFDPAASSYHSGSGAGTSVIDSAYDNVLVWNLGDECTQPNHTAYSQWVSVLQSADRVRRRPILCTARSGVREYSRIADILMMRREPLLSSLDFLTLRDWQQSYPLLARPDTPFWCTVQTQPSAKLANQWIMFEGNPQSICPFSYEQLRMQVYLALAAGAHGILFTSNTPLTNNDPESEFRRTALELLNWQLQLIEEWFAAGSVSPVLVKSNRRPMSSAVIQSGRLRLMVPIWQENRNQQALSAAIVGNVKYVISGIPETYDAYHLVPGGLYPIDTKRVAGGVQIELPEANLNSLIFFGEVDAMYANIGKRAKEIGARAAYLACRVAELQLAAAEQVLSMLKQSSEMKAIPVHPKDNLPLIAVKEQETMINTTKNALDLAKNLAQRRPPDYARAYLQAEIATRGLRVTAREMLQEATRHELNLCMTPVSVSFATLPYYLTAYQRTNGAKLGENRLHYGDMENLYQMSQAGWETVSHRIEGVGSPKRDTAANAKRSGQKGLQMIVIPAGLEDKPVQLETAPIWITTPPVPVRMGEMICVNGWIRIPRRLESTVDGLMIFDSLGGESLALRFVEAQDWREFAFYRNVPADGNYYVTFGLQGFGEVHIDDVRISGVQFEIPAQIPVPSQQPATPTPWQRLNPFQYLPPIPIWNQ
ncbi:MAG: hypothetical protein LBU34_11380 [Planctomycetaceae bacterium]|jgi:hypothetical protein|nr:hypothetical protein [Planctomycetaceae bacterium]